MTGKGAVKGLGSQIIKKMLERGEEGVGAEHVRHHRKTLWKFTQSPGVSEEEESLARLGKPMQGK
jgi:hypothetical protein